MTVELVVDTSAMIAILNAEDGYLDMRSTLVATRFALPTPVLVEFWRVARRGNRLSVELINEFLGELLISADIIPFSSEHALAATAAQERYGSGNGLGGPLNMLDLMVYGVAKIMNLPILCIGKDFAATDAMIHPASRID